MSCLYSKDKKFKRNSQALKTLLVELGPQEEVILLGDFLDLAIGSLDEVYQHFLEDLFKLVNYIIQPAYLEELEAFNNFWLKKKEV
jgi:hypothetical protein